MPNCVIVDTSAIYALISSSDEFQGKARQKYEELIDSDAELYTTSYILVEAMALVHHRLGFPPLRTLVESTQDIWKVYWIDQDTHGEAWREMKDRNGSRLSLVDCSTLVIARRLNASIFAFDEDFRQEQGVKVVP